MGTGSINTKSHASWLFIAKRKDDSGLVVSREFELLDTTLEDFLVMTEIAPSVVDSVFVDEKGYSKENVELYKIIRAPMGIIEEEDED